MVRNSIYYRYPSAKYYHMFLVYFVTTGQVWLCKYRMHFNKLRVIPQIVAATSLPYLNSDPMFHLYTKLDAQNEQYIAFIS